MAVGAAVVLAFVVYSVLASLVASPRIFTDELAYWSSGASLLDGHPLSVRGERYELGPLYPGLLAVILSIAPDREVAYELAKLVNALLFALTAIPVYLLARRVLRPWPSVGVAALSILVPSSMYVSVVMTESVAYPSIALALLAVALALERPTPARQGFALAAIALASTARLQFLVLIPAYLLALALMLALRGTSRSLRSRMVELWPTATTTAVVAIGIAAWGVVSGAWAPDLLGDYGVLVRDYDLTDVGGWLVYHLANLELYLAVAPLAVAPIVVTSFLRRGRGGSRPHAAFVALFLSVNAAILLLAAAFNSTEYAHERLHDRYTFYLVPLWLIVLFAWLQDRAPRPLLAAAAGGAIAIALPLFIPYTEYAREDGAQRFAGVASTLWAATQTAVADETYVWGEVLLFAVVVTFVVATFALPRRLVGLTVAAVVLTFVVTAELAWYLAVRDGTNWAFANTPAGRRWVDERLPSGGVVTSLSIADPCENGLVGGDSFHRTEFFNERVTRAAHVGGVQTQLPSTEVRIGPGGRLLLTSGKPFTAEYVLAQPGVLLGARRLAVGTVGELALWEVAGPVRLVGIGAAGRLDASVCRQSS